MNKEQRTILQLYGAFIISIIFNFLPSSALQAFGGLLFIILIIAIYLFRAKSDENSLMHSHMAYLIKSFWVSSLFITIGIIAAFLLADHSLINENVEAIANGAVPSEEEMKVLMMDYARSNFLIFVLTLGPSILYLLYRSIKGFMKARKEQFITNSKNWF